MILASFLGVLLQGQPTLQSLCSVTLVCLVYLLLLGPLLVWAEGKEGPPGLRCCCIRVAERSLSLAESKGLSGCVSSLCRGPSSSPFGYLCCLSVAGSLGLTRKKNAFFGYLAELLGEPSRQFGRVCLVLSAGLP